MQSCILWSSASVFVTERMAVIHSLMQQSILWRVLHLFWQENMQSFIVWGILSAVLYCTYWTTVLFSTVLYIFPMLKFTAIPLCQHTFLQRISEHQLPRNKLLIKAAIFLEQHRLYWNESSHLKELLFHGKIFFGIPSCLSYFLLITVFL